MLENKGFDKYSVRVDGSGRVTDRNRRFLRAFKPAEAPRIPAPRLPVDEPQGPGQREDAHDSVPRIPTEVESEPPPVMIDVEPQEMATPSPQHCTPSPQPPPCPTPPPVSRPQRIRKPSSLLNPDTWDLKTVQIFLKNFVSQLNEVGFQDAGEGRGGRSGNGHS